jgi:hypothetical protein
MSLAAIAAPLLGTLPASCVISLENGAIVISGQDDDDDDWDELEDDWEDFWDDCCD